jgi:hypothetical protein
MILQRNKPLDPSCQHRSLHHLLWRNAHLLEVQVQVWICQHHLIKGCASVALPSKYQSVIAVLVISSSIHEFLFNLLLKEQLLLFVE